MMGLILLPHLGLDPVSLGRLSSGGIVKLAIMMMHGYTRAPGDERLEAQYGDQVHYAVNVLIPSMEAALLANITSSLHQKKLHKNLVDIIAYKKDIDGDTGFGLKISRGHGIEVRMPEARLIDGGYRTNDPAQYTDENNKVVRIANDKVHIHRSYHKKLAGRRPFTLETLQGWLRFQQAIDPQQPPTNRLSAYPPHVELPRLFQIGEDTDAEREASTKWNEVNSYIAFWGAMQQVGRPESLAKLCNVETIGILSAKAMDTAKAQDVDVARSYSVGSVLSESKINPIDIES